MKPMEDQETQSEHESVGVVTSALLCPIFDRENRPMNVGDSFAYQPGTPFESVATISLRGGAEWLSFSDTTPDILLADFWYGPMDSRISALHNANCPDAGEKGKADE